MKFLGFLGVVQVILLSMLLWMTLHPGRPAAATQPGAGTGQAPDPAGQPLAATESAAGQAGLDEQRLRQIIREELDLQLRSTATALTPAAEAGQPDPVSPVEYRQRLDAAMQTLDYHLEQGRISEADMANLQAEIARLDEEGRKLMLSLLTQAFNSGELEGRF